MIPDQFTIRVAGRLPWSYAEVHERLREAAELGVRPEEAERALHVVAANRLHARYVWQGYLRKWRMLRAVAAVRGEAS